MTSLRVWAPFAKTLELDIAGKRVPFERSADAHDTFVVPWREVKGPYMLRIDGGDPITDPRAQDVETVLGPCHAVDTSAFTWNDRGFEPKPLAQALVYELHVGTFSPEGTFDGAIARLPQLVDLGVTHVEVMPVATFSGDRGWGYDGAMLFAPHRAYGGPAGLARFVDRAHALGLSVILDVVYNHLGPIGNMLGRFGPYFREDRNTPWGSALNFDGENSAGVRRFFIDNALMWLRDYHIDGLRLDAVHSIHDESAIPFLEELSIAVHGLGARIGKRLVLIAESDLNDPRVVRPIESHGLGMDAQWCDDFHHALHVALTGEQTGYYEDFTPNTTGRSPLATIAHALERGYVYEGQLSPHRKRRHGRALGAVSLDKLVGYAQTHDQVGNRARGERLSQLTEIAKVEIALGLVLTSPFVPMLFMGEEWAASTPFQFFTDHRDEAIANATREGRRREFAGFGWKPEDVPDPQDVATFERSKLRWDERDRAPHGDVLGFTRALIALRQSHPELGAGAPIRCTVDETRQHLVMQRGAISVVVNLGERAKVELGRPLERVLLASIEPVILDGTLEMAPASIAIVSCGISAAR